jgi:hypothetical protein
MGSATSPLDAFFRKDDEKLIGEDVETRQETRPDQTGGTPTRDS